MYLSHASMMSVYDVLCIASSCVVSMTYCLCCRYEDSSSYMSFKKQTGRAGFYGNYHRSSPLLSPPQMLSPTGDSQSGKGRTRARVGKAAATVIFSSNAAERPTHVNFSNEEIEHTSVSAQIANFEKVSNHMSVSDRRSESFCGYPSYSRSKSSGALPDLRESLRSYRRARSDRIPDVVVSDESGQESTGTDSPRSISSPPPSTFVESRQMLSRSTPSLANDDGRISPVTTKSKVRPDIKLKLYANFSKTENGVKSPTENGLLSPPIGGCESYQCRSRSESPSPSPRRRRSEEDRELLELTEEVANRTLDRKLSSLLRSDPQHKTMADYITGLFDTDVQPRSNVRAPVKLRTSKSFTVGENQNLKKMPSQS